MPRDGIILIKRAALLSLVIAAASGASRLDDAVARLRQGKLQEGRQLLFQALPSIRKANNPSELAFALTTCAKASVALGDYRAAVDEASESLAIRRSLPNDQHAGEDFNTLGLAYQYLADYSASELNFQYSVRFYRSHADADGEITGLNNIGNIYYFEGRYLDALHSYSEALDRVNATTRENWNPRRRQLTVANLAALYQRLGQEPKALELYRQLTSSRQAMPPDEEAQLLINQGALYRRMGDPIKALELYAAAQKLFASAEQRDGEIAALRNIGIARAVDLNDLPGALATFTAAGDLSRRSSNVRGEVQADLYRAEALRKLQRLPEAGTAASDALARAQSAKLVEEEWKALFVLGRISAAEAGTDIAAGYFTRSIAVIESVRTNLRTPALRNDFLADKREVYDSLIDLLLHRDAPPVAEIYQWMERSRARTLRDRLGKVPAAPWIQSVQSRLAPDAVLLDCWVYNGQAAVLWIDRSGFGLVRQDSLSAPAPDQPDAWQQQAGRLLDGIPVRSHVIIVPDGWLNGLPFEALRTKGSGRLLIEQSDVTYLPSAELVAVPGSVFRPWYLPWHPEFAAFGDPPPPAQDNLSLHSSWAPLPASAEEVRSIAKMLPGRSDIHLGSDASKRYLLNHGLANVPLIHFSTHAAVDKQNPDRSRILLASDYLFQEEASRLDLRAASLVTVSACDTALGKEIAGEGVQAFSRAFLAAGAHATLTSLWKVADQPTTDFMRQFYYHLAAGETKAEALRSAKLRFLHSGSALADPRYWAAFVLTGDGWEPGPHVIPWSVLIGFVAAVSMGFAALRSRVSRKRR